MPKRRRRCTPPLPLPRGQHTRVEAPQRPNDQEDRRIGRGIVDGRGDVAHSDRWLSGRAGVHVDLVVAGTIVRAEAEGFREGVDEFWKVLALSHCRVMGGATDLHPKDR